jgi:hypothetical protein
MQHFNFSGQNRITIIGSGGRGRGGGGRGRGGGGRGGRGGDIPPVSESHYYLFFTAPLSSFAV